MYEKKSEEITTFLSYFCEGKKQNAKRKRFESKPKCKVFPYFPKRFRSRNQKNFRCDFQKKLFAHTQKKELWWLELL